MGCRTEPAAVHIAHVLQRLHFFQFFNFFHNLHDVPQKKLHSFTAKIKNSIFFIIHTTYSKKKITRIYSKKITRRDSVFVHDLHFSPVCTPFNVLLQLPPCLPVSLALFPCALPRGLHPPSPALQQPGNPILLCSNRRPSLLTAAHLRSMPPCPSPPPRPHTSARSGADDGEGRKGD